MRHPHGETVVHHHLVLGDEDEYGDRVETWVDSEVEHVAVAVTSVQEPVGDGQWRVVEKTALYFDPPLAPAQGDEFTVRGLRFRVTQGSPLSVWSNPFTGDVPGSEVFVERVTG